MEVSFIAKADIECIEQDWRCLEKGAEMSYFQTYDWYKSIMPYIPEDCSRFESCFAVLYKDDIAKIIAPLWIIKRTFNLINKKGVYLLGHGGWSDYLNFVYSDVKEGDIVCLINEISKHFGCHYFGFDDVPERSLLYTVIIGNYTHILDEKTTCVELKLPENADAYKKMLSKNSKQNLRTATNRLAKTNLLIEFKLDDIYVDKATCKAMREVRLPQKKGRYGWFQQLKIKIVTILHFYFHFDLPFFTDSNSHIMTAYINGDLAAFFNYGLDTEHRRVVLMAVGTSEKYGWYSPGMLLMYEYIQHQLEVHKIDVIDFTRGNEKYKYSLGGVEHYNHHVVFNV